MIRKFCLALAVMITASFTMASAQQTAKVTASGIGYLEYLPKGYKSSSKKYPLVISLHGIKEKGTSSRDPKRVLADLPKVDNVGLPKYVTQGQDYPFILISPQLKGNMGTWSSSYVIEVLNYVKKHLRVDERRIYLTGLSLGGFGVWRTAGDYPGVFAAIAPVCPGGNALNKASAIAAKDLPIWGFHGSNDKVVSSNVTLKMINAVNSAPHKPKPLAKATIFPGMGHIIWDRAYKQTNLLDWMLSHTKGSGASGSDNGNDNNNNDNKPEKPDDKPDKPSSKNKLPVASAGPDRVITLPTSAVTVKASASDKDGKIASYEWTQTYGKSVSLSGNRSSQVRISGLREGNFIFRLRVKDNDGGIADDYFKITVKKSGNNNGGRDDDKPSGKQNIKPVASAGPDRVITLPTNSVSIRANATDKDGKIVSYEWTQTYGNHASISGKNSSTVKIYNLSAGAHIFRLRVKDNDGAIKDDYFKITVKASKNKSNGNASNGRPGNSNGNSNNNNKPSANAGPDRIVTVSTNSVRLAGSGKDTDGRIVSYKWEQLAGPNNATIKNSGSANATVTNLKKGRYYFSLTVKDDNNAVDVDKMLVRVTGS